MSSAELTWRANAEANLLQARQRHGARLGSKKSRNGCSVCKARRVKCDEGKPECQKCSESGRQCKYDGLSTPSNSDKVKGTLIRTPPSQMLGLREIDRRTFDYFISYTAPRLAGAWDKVLSSQPPPTPKVLIIVQEFWCNNVLQLAQQEPFVLDSLLAISVLYEHPQYMASFKGKPGESPHPDYPGTCFERPEVIDDHYTHAIQLYNRAIRRFSAQMHDGKATHPTALLSCVLFICIETIRDNVFGAMGLFVQGTNMLKGVDRSRLSSDEESMLTLMEHIFQRMAVQAVLYGHPSGPSLRYELSANACRDFQTLAEARSVLFGLAVSSHSFMQQADDFRRTLLDAMARYSSHIESESSDYLHGLEIFGITRDPSSIFYGLPHSTSTDDHIEQHGALNALRSFFDHLGPDSNTAKLWDPEDLAKQRRELLSKLNQWSEGFRILLERTGDETKAPEAVSYLRMYHLTSYIWVSTRLETTETVFDAYTAEFRQLLRHAEVYVRSTALQVPVFTFEIGAVLPLFLAASKCRVPSVRRQALDLILQCPRKESTFGAYSCAEAICRLITVEEAGLGLPPPDLSGRCGLRTIDDSVWVPENKRVHSFDLLKNRKDKIFEMRVTRFWATSGSVERVVEDFLI